MIICFLQIQELRKKVCKCIIEVRYLLRFSPFVISLQSCAIYPGIISTPHFLFYFSNCNTYDGFINKFLNWDDVNIRYFFAVYFIFDWDLIKGNFFFFLEWRGLLVDRGDCLLGWFWDFNNLGFFS